jgi:mono/diheme cytochrome c family protein
MPGFSGSLSHAEIEAVSRYIAGLGGVTTTITTAIAGGAAEDPSTPAERAVVGGSGAGLFSTHCAACHTGRDSSGGAFDGESLAFPETLEILVAGADGMPGFESRLSPDELMILAGYTVMLSHDGAPAGSPDIEEIRSDDDEVHGSEEGEADESREREREDDVQALGPTLVAGHSEAPGPSFSKILLVTGLIVGLAGLWGVLAVRVVRVLLRR